MVPGQCWQLLVLNVPFSCLIAASGSVARRGEWSGWVIRNPKLLMLRQAGVCSEQKPWLWRLSRGPASECRFYGEDLYLVIWWVAMNERFKVIYYDIYKTHWWPALTVVSWESGKKNLRALPLKVNSLITHRWEQEHGGSSQRWTCRLCGKTLALTQTMAGGGKKEESSSTVPCLIY